MRITKSRLTLLIAAVLLIVAMAIPLTVTNFTQVHIDAKPQGGTATPRLLVDNLDGPSVIAEFRDNRTPVARWPDGGGMDLLNTALENVDHIQFNRDFEGTNEIGKLNWDNTDGTIEVGALGGQVVLQVGQESHIRGVNKSGSVITDGFAVTLTGAQGLRPKIELSDADNSPLHDSVVGLATENIPNNQEGYVTAFGFVRGLNTSAFSEGDRLWATTTPGVISNTFPAPPARKVFVGVVASSHITNGSIFVNPVNVPNLSALSDILVTSIADRDIILWDDANSRWKNNPSGPTFLTESASTQGLGANPDIFLFGFYEWAVLDANLNQGATTATLGDANVSHASHAFIVTSGAGAAASGVVEIRATGTSITDAGVRTVSDTQTILADITTAAADTYYETSKKWLGTVTFELNVTSGAPATYNLDFNYGLSKYEDSLNNDFTIVGIQATGFAGAADNDFDVQLYHHDPDGTWIYSAAGFTPLNAGNLIASLVTDHSIDDQLANRDHFAWKRTDLSTNVLGSISDGIIVLIASSANNAIEYANVRISIEY
jgi:hypothetical protein